VTFGSGSEPSEADVSLGHSSMTPVPVPLVTPPPSPRPRLGGPVAALAAVALLASACAVASVGLLLAYGRPAPPPSGADPVVHPAE